MPSGSWPNLPSAEAEKANRTEKVGAVDGTGQRRQQRLRPSRAGSSGERPDRRPGAIGQSSRATSGTSGAQSQLASPRPTALPEKRPEEMVSRIFGDTPEAAAAAENAEARKRKQGGKSRQDGQGREQRTRHWPAAAARPASIFGPVELHQLAWFGVIRGVQPAPEKAPRSAWSRRLVTIDDLLAQKSGAGHALPTDASCAYRFRKRRERGPCGPAQGARDTSCRTWRRGDVSMQRCASPEGREVHVSTVSTSGPSCRSRWKTRSSAATLQVETPGGACSAISPFRPGRIRTR